MLLELYLSPAEVVCYANDNTALIPQVWANEGLALLTENFVVANLVNREFEDEIAQFGETVHTRQPNHFNTRRKTDNDTLEYQDATVTDVEVKLNQWFYRAFIIKDGEQSKSFQDLIRVHLLPAMLGIARDVDRALLGHVHEFLGGPLTRAGRLGSLDSSNGSDFILDAMEVLDSKLCPEDGRRMIVSPKVKSDLLKTKLFTAVNESGDNSALRRAMLGQLYGFDTFMSQNVPSLRVDNTENATGTVTNALAAGGSGSQAVTITGYQALVGEYATVAGNDQPTHITAATVGAGNTTAVTLHEANKYATAANAVIRVYKAADVKGAYAVGYSKAVAIDGFPSGQHPQRGQLIAFGTGANRRVYTIIESEFVSATERNLHLDRPLELALADNDLAFPGPAGSYNYAFHRDAIALVSRPLVTSQDGITEAVASMNGLSIRVQMQKDIDVGGTKVNVDMLAGIKTLDTDLAAVMLG